MLRVTPQGIDRHERHHRRLGLAAIGNIGENLVHTRDFDNHLAPWLEHPAPLGKQVSRLKNVEMLKNMDSRNHIG